MMSFLLNFFPVPQTTLQDCGKQYLPVFDVVWGVCVGFVPFMEIGCINPLLAGAKPIHPMLQHTLDTSFSC
jgi:hypothetical protein